MELERVDLLHHASRAVTIDRTIQKLLLVPFESIEPRRVGAEGEINRKWTDGRTVAQANPRRLHHVVKILQVSLAKAQADVVQ